jgi:hypothetical protein
MPIRTILTNLYHNVPGMEAGTGRFLSEVGKRGLNYEWRNWNHMDTSIMTCRFVELLYAGRMVIGKDSPIHFFI